jgi:hypothetical protein
VHELPTSTIFFSEKYFRNHTTGKEGRVWQVVSQITKDKKAECGLTLNNRSAKNDGHRFFSRLLASQAKQCLFFSAYDF